MGGRRGGKEGNVFAGHGGLEMRVLITDGTGPIA